MNKLQKGFTLIELLIVIGILAILATVTVLVLNPAQLFAQARDSQRVEDLKTLSTAINLYLTTVSSPQMQSGSFTCGTNFGATVGSASSSFAANTILNAGVFTVTGLGWVPVDFSAMTSAGGSPISTLPRDPTNTAGTGIAGTGLYYDYSCDNGNKWYELNGGMESTRYSTGGADDRESNDGGTSTSFYEIGNKPGLSL